MTGHALVTQCRIHWLSYIELNKKNTKNIPTVNERFLLGCVCSHIPAFWVPSSSVPSTSSPVVADVDSGIYCDCRRRQTSVLVLRCSRKAWSATMERFESRGGLPNSVVVALSQRLVVVVRKVVLAIGVAAASPRGGENIVVLEWATKREKEDERHRRITRRRSLQYRTGCRHRG